jgi:hypothetical protein
MSALSPLPPQLATPPIPALPPIVGTPGQAPAIVRVQAFAMRALAETHYRVSRLGTAGLTGLALLLSAAVLFYANNLPQSAAIAALQAQLARPAPRVQPPIAAAPGTAPLATLPTRGTAPAVVAKILEEAQASGVQLQRGEYEFIPARDGLAARYRMNFPVKTSYPKLRVFMDRTLLALPAVALEGLRLERKSVGEDAIDGELKLSVFVRSDE